MKIVIVGGGTAGWMATAALAKTFPEYDITIIVGNEPIGVGESTTPHINQYLHYMGITDEVFIPAARATYRCPLGLRILLVKIMSSTILTDRI